MGVAVGLAPTQHGLQARHQFARLEGFGQIVVGAQLQPHHAVHHIAARGEHDNGNVAVFADGAAEFKAVHLGQHHIQNRRVKRLAAQQGQALAGARGVGDLQLETLEIRGQRRAELLVVVDQQDTVHGAFLHVAQRTVPHDQAAQPVLHRGAQGVETIRR